MPAEELTRVFNPAEPRGPHGRWAADAAALSALATTIRQAQVANVIVTGEHAGRTADLLDQAAAALKRGDRATAEKILARLRGAAASHKHLRKHLAQIRHHHQHVTGPVEALMARADDAARADWREALHPRDRRGEFASKQSLLDTADHAGKLLGANNEVPARLRTAAEAAGNKDYATVARQVAKARDVLARSPQGGHSGVIEMDVAEHPMAQQRRALEGRLRAHLRQARERTRPGGTGPVASVTRGLGWELLELELISREKFTPSLHPRDAHGEFARKPYGHVPAGMNTPNMRLAEKAGLVKAGQVQQGGRVPSRPRRPAPGRPLTAPRRPVTAGGPDVRIVSKRRRVTQTTGPGGTTVTEERSTASGTVSMEQFTSAVDSLHKSLAEDRASLDAQHQAEIDRLQQEIVHARDEAVAEAKRQQSAAEHRKSIRKWINHILALIGVGVMTYMEAHGSGAEPIMSAVAATGPLLISELVDLVKKL